MDAQQVIIFGNPRAGARSGSELVRRLESELAARDFQVVVEFNASQLAGRVAQSQGTGRLAAVVAAGGDGTVQLVVNRVPLGTPITLLPLGTENLLARHVGMTADPQRIVQTILGARHQRLDLVEATSSTETKRFVLMMGCGFDAEVVHRLDATRTGHISHWSYAKPIWNAIRQYTYPAMTVTYEESTGAELGTVRTLEAHFVFAFNVPAYASGIPFAPQAHPADGLLDVCCFAGRSFPRGLFHLATIWSRTHGHWSGCHRFRTSRLRVDAASPVPVQLDGDPGGAVPIEISVLPAALTLVVP